MVDDENGIEEVPDRSRSRLARAPQSFWLKDIIGAHRKAIAENKHDFIDSCSMMQYYGHKLYLIEGPQENIKITTPMISIRCVHCWMQERMNKSMALNNVLTEDLNSL